jgi:hypothetical protein
MCRLLTKDPQSIHRTIGLPAVMYGHETWSEVKNMERKSARTGCEGEYLDLSRRKCKENGGAFQDYSAFFTK